ncbi:MULTISPECIES: TetR/AcrR family transcriptional regulator [unclassified Staphylococcus]|uniref:TetR/AcrR family transcriptional regulator n=1 Tax=unclassified Staphylococcus TaxID=91994 RepID=UPI0021D3295C|nr:MULTISPECIES: TetR/AcrR family transcriptional regulator [unclassified Staphylococcus]UXR77951.1 TetR/AcrR family transcriptional regulator [Staphylococcus sp. IVB6227]UXR82112.1 TetR/AcrR family transcriptional regulator [Staphylococcus sp. IVB6214]
MNKNDLRYKKTEWNLHHSYLTLLETLPCKEITIKKICEYALCSRNTFYLHYTSKDHLHESMVNTLLDKMSAAFKSHVNHAKQIDTKLYLSYIEAIINSVLDNKRMMTVFAKNDNGLFFKQFCENIETAVYDETSSISQQENTAIKKLYTAYLAASLTGFIFEWLSNDDITDDIAKKALHQIHIHTMSTFTKSL